MAIGVKKATDYRNIDGTLYEVHPKTEASQVVYGSETVASALAAKADAANAIKKNDVLYDLNAFMPFRIYQEKLDNTFYAAGNFRHRSR